ncbi:MAG: hypothetical protein RMX59_035180 [Nostoc sp. DedSLP05]
MSYCISKITRHRPPSSLIVSGVRTARLIVVIAAYLAIPRSIQSVL